MDIITDFSNNLYENHLNKLKFYNDKVDNYVNLVECIDDFSVSLAKQTYIDSIKKVDDDFFNSSSRKKKYYSKGFITKSIITLFGPIKLKRRRYIDKLTKRSYIHADEQLCLEKHSRIDPLVLAELIDNASGHTFAEAARITNKLIGQKIKFNDNHNKQLISRATARNNILKFIFNFSGPPNDALKIKKDIYIMFDELFVGSQNTEYRTYCDYYGKTKTKQTMIKAGVVFDGVRVINGRNSLKNKRIFATIEKTPKKMIDEMITYLSNNYEMKFVENIFIMGDGANWIKAVSKNKELKLYKNNKVIHCLDNYHFSQAIERITTSKHHLEYFKYIKDSVINNEMKEFKNYVNDLIYLQSHREEIILKQQDYILNNWNHIQNTFHVARFGCSMEATISHVFATAFTARPKGYKKENLKKLINLKLMKTNGYDIKRKVFESINNNIRKEKIDNINKKINVFKNNKYLKPKASILNENIRLTFEGLHDNRFLI